MRAAALAPRSGEAPATFSALDAAARALLGGPGAERTRYRVVLAREAGMHEALPHTAAEVPVVLKTREYDLIYEREPGRLESRAHAHFPEILDMQTILSPLPVQPTSLLLWAQCEWRAREAVRSGDGEARAFSIQHPELPEYELWAGADDLPLACWFRQERAVTHARFAYGPGPGAVARWPSLVVRVRTQGRTLVLERLSLAALRDGAAPGDLRFALPAGVALRDARTEPAIEHGREVARWPTEFARWIEGPQPLPRSGGAWPVVAGLLALLAFVGALLYPRGWKRSWTLRNRSGSTCV